MLHVMLEIVETTEKDADSIPCLPNIDRYLVPARAGLPVLCHMATRSVVAQLLDPICTRHSLALLQGLR